MNSWTSQILKNGSAYVFPEAMACSGVNVARPHHNICMLTWLKADLNTAEKSHPLSPTSDLWPAGRGKGKKRSDEVNVFTNALLLPFYSNSFQ